MSDVNLKPTGWSGINPLVNPSNTPGTTGTTGTPGTPPPVGQGTTATGGATPPVGSPVQTDVASGILAMVTSLTSLIPNLNDDQQDVQLAEVTMAMKKLQEATGDNQVNNQSDLQKRELDEKEKKLKDAAKKLEQAAYDAKHASIWDKIKAFFEAIGAIFAIILGAIADIIPGAGVALIVAGTVGLIMAIDDEVKATTGLGIAGNIDKLVHPNDPDSWQKADMGFEIACMAVAAVSMVVGMAMGTGEAQVAEMSEEIEGMTQEGLDDATDLEDASDLEDTAGESSNVGSQKLTVGLKIATGANDAVTAAGSVVQGVYQYDATTEQAEAKKDQAKEKEIEALVDELEAIIDVITKQLASNGQRWSKMLDSVSDSMKDRNDTVNNAKFRA